MVLAYPRAAQPSPLELRPRPAPPARPRVLGRPRFEALRALTLTPLDEARALEARAFAELPLPTVLELEVPGWSGPCCPDRAMTGTWRISCVAGWTNRGWRHTSSA